METKKIIHKIAELEIGDIVALSDYSGYARVAVCIHGERYYQYLGDDIESHIATVTDHDEDYIPCCG